MDENFNKINKSIQKLLETIWLFFEEPPPPKDTHTHTDLPAEIIISQFDGGGSAFLEVQSSESV